MKTKPLLSLLQLAFLLPRLSAYISPSGTGASRQRRAPSLRSAGTPPASGIVPFPPTIASTEEDLVTTVVAPSVSSTVLSFDPLPPALSPDRPDPPFLRTLWRFTRPHTIIGSLLAIPAISFLSLPSLLPPDIFSFLFLIGRAMVPALLMNLYITGLNQITDVEIDKINKPDLVIPAGDLRLRDASLIVIVAGLLGCLGGFGETSSGGLRLVLWGSALLGTAYSLPPIRLKRFPLLAATSIVVVRGTLINVGFYQHAISTLSSRAPQTILSCLFDPRCALSSLYFGLFGIVIALMKDVPDVRGDALMKIQSFSVRIGQQRIFKTARRLLAVLFGITSGGLMVGACIAPSQLIAACRASIGVAAACMGYSVRKKAQDVNPEDSQEVYNYYMYLWKLFYLSYFALPFAK